MIPQTFQKKMTHDVLLATATVAKSTVLKSTRSTSKIYIFKIICELLCAFLRTVTAVSAGTLSTVQPSRHASRYGNRKDGPSPSTNPSLLSETWRPTFPKIKNSVSRQLSAPRGTFIRKKTNFHTSVGSDRSSTGHSQFIHDLDISKQIYFRSYSIYMI